MRVTGADKRAGHGIHPPAQFSTLHTRNPQIPAKTAFLKIHTDALIQCIPTNPATTAPDADESINTQHLFHT